jgi:hypothetical protein
MLPNYLSGKSAVTTLERATSGGMIRISAPSLDRDRDRVMPMGAQLDAYRRNPVVQWGHGYAEPWQTIGRTVDLSVSADGIDALFELREPASDSDPQHIVLALWNGGFINASSIGFQPLAAEPNDFGGLDFTSWEMLEFSLVPIPANRDALRRAADEHPLAAKAFGLDIVKAGRVLSKANEARLREAYAAIGAVLEQLGMDEEDDDKYEAAKILSVEPLLTAGNSPAPAPEPINLTAMYHALRGLSGSIKRSL